MKELASTKDTSTQRLLVSVILATFNEAPNIERCIASVLDQEAADFDLEILVIDGNSDDGTREILENVAALDSRVRVLVNERRKTPFAFNLGLKAARGKYVCIFGSHTVYKRDYISVCLRELIAQGAGGCGGRVITRPANNTLQARLVSWTLGHPFGSSRKSFRTQPEGFVDVVNYPVLLSKALIEVGGYSEELSRNQDNDMNQRLRAKGYKLFCTWKTQCLYHPKGTIKDLLSYASRNGFWNVVSLKHNFASMRARHFIPFLFLMALLFSVVPAIAAVFLSTSHRNTLAAPFVSLCGLHLCVGLISSLQIAVRERCLAAFWLPPLFLGFHIAYGFGTLLAVVAHPRLLTSVHEPLEKTTPTEHVRSDALRDL
jgi:succinoglycan biosynthesis protein ExoA